MRVYAVAVPLLKSQKKLLLRIIEFFPPVCKIIINQTLRVLSFSR